MHLYAKLSGDDRRELEQDVQVFLHEKSFEGGGGVEITDEMRVTIAAQACVLLLHRDTLVYPDLETILVYPSTYVVKAQRRDGFVVIEGPEARLGESWQRGLVVLAWDDVLRAVKTFGSGHNVVFHEFAHQLDQEDGEADGAPPHVSSHWSKVLGAEYETLGDRLHAGRRSDIDAYAATSPAEFFAVVTEEFFDKPATLKSNHPQLYEELVAFYNLDPASL